MVAAGAVVSEEAGAGAEAAGAVSVVGGAAAGASTRGLPIA